MGRAKMGGLIYFHFDCIEEEQASIISSSEKLSIDRRGQHSLNSSSIVYCPPQEVKVVVLLGGKSNSCCVRVVAAAAWIAVASFYHLERCGRADRLFVFSRKSSLGEKSQ